eukprot:Hpha_TRINITY_DN16877_c2_g6::TRINITY_DN16877_c2_g6_i1::g.153231::m.153231
MSIWLWVGAGVVASAVLMRLFAADVYDIVIVKMTAKWYAAVLNRLDEGSRVLDIGIGTASALCVHSKTLQQRRHTFVGVDYDAAYIKKANQVAARAAVSDRLRLHCKSVYDDDLRKATGDNFDAVYFSGSFTLMPDPVGALKATAGLLKPGGKIYITQTYQKRHTPVLGWLKPMLKYLTTIDFGQLTYETDIAKILKDSGMTVEENKPIPGSVDTYYQIAKLIVLKP